MDIYVIQPGDTIASIAEHFGTTSSQIIQGNGVINPLNLVPGQTLVITHPSQTHTVQEGDTLVGIAAVYGVSVMQLYRNNSFLHDRAYIYPGETLVISYPTEREITTIGYSYPYIREETLRRTLPYLTYLSVFNYRATAEGEIVSFTDDTYIISMAKEYGTVPIAMMTTLTAEGTNDLNVANQMLVDEEYQDRQLNNLIRIMREKGYQGANFIFYVLNISNQELYKGFLEKVSARMELEGFEVFVTINYQAEEVNGAIETEQIDYSVFAGFVKGMIFLQFIWGTNYGPPMPVSSIQNLHAIMDYVVPMVAPDKILIGKPILAFDWELPYPQSKKSANSLTLDAAIALAYDYSAIIQFDETSMTPYFYYAINRTGPQQEHVVWFIDARSIEVLTDLILEYELGGMGAWNIMVFYQQFWTIFITRFDIIKRIPDSFQ